MPSKPGDAGAPQERRPRPFWSGTVAFGLVTIPVALYAGVQYVVVEDAELEALAPKRSQEMELLRFVDVSGVDPALFQRGYVLAPGRGALRA